MKGILGLLALTTFFCLATTTAKAQVYQLKALDGTSVQIRLFYKPETRKFAICYLKDTLYLHDYWSHEARLLNGNFLEIAYSQRGGSNVGRGSTVLVCVSHNKLSVALHINSFDEYDMRNIYHNPGTLSEYKLYTAKLTTDVRNKLIVRIHDEYNSEENPSLNHKSDKSFTLLFDPAKHIFYSYNERINGHLVSFNYDRNLSIKIKKNFTGYAPAFRLGEKEYLFVGEAWYSRGESKLKNTYYQMD